MSLVLDFNVCQSSSCDELIFNEWTGLYNAISNPGGWNDVSTQMIIDATAATLDITVGSGTIYTIDLFAQGFPTENENIDYLLPNTSFGYSIGLPIDDQIITFKYTVIVNGITYTQTKTIAFYCQVKCCVLSMFKSLNFDCDSCHKQIDNALQAYAMLRGLEMDADSGNITAFNTALSTLKKICLNTNCKNCK